MGESDSSTILVVWGFMAVVCGFVSSAIWKGKGGSGGSGFLIGFILGVLGLIYVIAAKPDAAQSTFPQCPFCAEMVNPEAIVCKHCGRDLPTRPCPACSRSIQRTVGICPHCKTASDAWVLHEGHWWRVDESGASLWLTDAGEWIRA